MTELVCNTDVVWLFCGGHCTTLKLMPYLYCWVAAVTLQLCNINHATYVLVFCSNYCTNAKLIMLDMYWCVAAVTVQLQY